MAEPLVGLSVPIVLDPSKLKEGGEVAASSVSNMSGRIEAALKKIKGPDVAAAMEVTQKAVEKLGGVANLTAPQLERLRERLERLVKQGAEVPPSLQGVTREANKLAEAAKAAASGGGWGGVLGAISPQAVAAAAAVAGLTGAVIKLAGEVLKAGEWAEHIRNLEKTTGQTAKGIQVLEYAAKGAGVSFEGVVKGAEKLQEKLGEDSDAFAQLGLDVERLKTLDPTALFQEVTTKVAGLTTQHERAAAAVALFGKQGAETYLPLIEQLKALEQQAEATNYVLSDRELDALTKLDDKVDELAGAWEGLKRHLAAFIADSPALIDSIDLVTTGISRLSTGLTDISRGGGGGHGWYAAFLNLVSIAVAAGIAFDELLLKIHKFNGGPTKEIEESLKRNQALLLDIYEKYRKATVGPLNQGTPGGGAGGGSFTSKEYIVVPGIGRVKKTDWEAMVKSGEEWVARLNEKNKEIAIRNAELDGKTSAEAMERARKAGEAKYAMERDLAIKELALKKQISEDAARLEIENERKARDFLRQRAAADAELIAQSQVVLANADARTTASLKAKINAIRAATDAAIQNILASEKTSRAADDEAIANLKAAEALKIKAAAQQELLSDIAKIDDGFGELVGILDQLGVAADSTLGKAARAGQQAAAAAGSAVRAGAAFASGDVIGGVMESLKAVGQIIGAIKTAFSKPEYKKVMEDVGRSWGVSISEGLAKAIEETEKKLKVGRGLAELLNMSKIIGESGKDPREFVGRMVDLLQAISSGAVPAAEGLAEIGRDFNLLTESAERAGIVGDAAIVALIKRARELGELTPEMQKFLDVQAAGAAEGAKKISEGMAQLTTGTVGGQDWAISGADAATFFVYGFQKEIQAKGIMAALDDQGKGLDEFYAKMQAGGDTAALALLQPFKDLQDQLGEKGDLRGALTTLEGMDQVFKAMANSGDLTQKGIDAMGRSISGTFNALTEGGVSSQAALQAIQPELRSAVSAAQQYGFTLDANTQKLVDQSKEAGFAFPTEPLVQVVDLLRAIAEKLGADVPESARRASASIGGLEAPTAAVTAGILGVSPALDTVQRGFEALAGSWSSEASAMAQDVKAMADTTEVVLSGAAEVAAQGFEDLAAAAEAAFTGMEGDARDAMDVVIGQLRRLPRSINIPVGIPTNEQSTEGHAFGGFVNMPSSGGWDLLHGKEAIIPEGHKGDWFADMLRRGVAEGLAAAGAAGRGAGSPGVPIHLTVQIGARTLFRELFDASQNRELRIHEDAIVKGGV